MVSTGDRSAKIRTYNYPQGRVTDHRINFTLYNLQAVMDGEIDEIIETADRRKYRAFERKRTVEMYDLSFTIKSYGL